MAQAKTWYVSCSPRSPEKIIPELGELAKLDGQDWRCENANGEKITQIKFANLLSELETFEGTISKKTPDFSARDRVAPMQTYGFAFVDSSGVIRITPAGWQLLEGKRTQELFLKQMLKWQYPSWQHGGNPRTCHKYPRAEDMGIFPFVETLRICRELKGLSKAEIAIYVLPLLNSDKTYTVIEEITWFREQLSKYKGLERKRFIYDVHKQKYHDIYYSEIRSGKLKTRESATKTSEDFLAKKIANSNDVADATIRYFRATGLFTLSADFHGLAISSLQSKEVNTILDKMTFQPVSFYNNVDKFYNYMGNSEVPALSWLQQSKLIEKVVSLGVSTEEANRLNTEELKDVIEFNTAELKEKRLTQYLYEVKKPEYISDILEMFGRIKNNDVLERPLKKWPPLASSQKKTRVCDDVCHKPWFFLSYRQNQEWGLPYFSFSKVIILFRLTANIVVAPCNCIPTRPEPDATSYPCLCFSSLFLASIL